MTPPIPESEYQMSTEDHRGTESRVMHLRFNWTRQQMIFMKSVQHWGAAAKDQNGDILSFNSPTSAQEVLRQIPLRVALSITEQEGYTKDSTVIAWKDLSITEKPRMKHLSELATKTQTGYAT